MDISNNKINKKNQIRNKIKVHEGGETVMWTIIGKIERLDVRWFECFRNTDKKFTT